MHTVKVSVRGLYHNAKPFCGKIRFKLSCCSAIGNSIIVPKEWDEYPFETNSEIVEINLIPNTLTGENSFYYYEIEYCKNTGAYIYDKYGKRKAILSGVCVVPDHDCNFIDIATIEAPEADPVDLSKAYASEAKKALTDAKDEANLAESSALRAEQILKEIESTETAGHLSDYNNPHKVTAEQVGADAKGTAEAKVAEHANRTDNPHSVTAEQIGAANSEAVNASISAIEAKIGENIAAIAKNATDIGSTSKAVGTLQENLNAHIAGAITQADIDAAVAPVSQQVATNTDNITANATAIAGLQKSDADINAALSTKANASDLATTNANVTANTEAIAQNKTATDNHIGNKSNPHGVTAEQVGADAAGAANAAVEAHNASDSAHNSLLSLYGKKSAYNVWNGINEFKKQLSVNIDGVPSVSFDKYRTTVKQYFYSEKSFSSHGATYLLDRVELQGKINYGEQEDITEEISNDTIRNIIRHFGCTRYLIRLNETDEFKGYMIDILEGLHTGYAIDLSYSFYKSRYTFYNESENAIDIAVYMNSDNLRDVEYGIKFLTQTEVYDPIMVTLPKHSTLSVEVCINMLTDSVYEKDIDGEYCLYELQFKNLGVFENI